MAFRELKGTGGKNFFKWPTVGITFEGVFKALSTGMFEGKVTYHAIFVDREGKSIQVNTPTILRDKLTEAEAGMNLRLTYIGNLQGKGAKTGAKDFRVEVLGDQVPDAPQPQAAPQAQAPVETEAEKQARLFAAFLASQKPAEPVAGVDEYAQLVAKLKAKDEKGAPSLLTALENIYKTPETRTEALRSHLKAQGVAV
jgi:hypothetical protein